MSYLKARFVTWYIRKTQAVPDVLITGDQGERHYMIVTFSHVCRKGLLAGSCPVSLHEAC